MPEPQHLASRLAPEYAYGSCSDDRVNTGEGAKGEKASPLGVRDFVFLSSGVTFRLLNAKP